MFTKYFLLLLYAACLHATTTITTYTYKTVGDLKIKLDVILPPIPPPASGFPVLFTIHGGGDIQGQKSTALNPQEVTETMNRGWAIVAIDYRLIPGVFLADILEDVQDAYQWMRTELIKSVPINIDLVTVIGRSAGGGLAVLSGYKLTPRPQAIIGFYSFCTNWTDPYAYKPETPVPLVFVAAANKLAVPVVTEYTMSGETDPKNVLWNGVLASGKMGWLVTTHDPAFPQTEIMAQLKTFSATENMDENYPPTYLAHGLVDTLVPYSQSVQLANKLKEYNIPYVLDLVPGANHNFDNHAEFWTQHVVPVFDFAQKYMQQSSKAMEFLAK